MIGDLRFGRTVHSLSKLLASFDRVHLTLHRSGGAAHAGRDRRGPARARAHRGRIRCDGTVLDGQRRHRLYLTRIQEERFTSREEANLYRGRYPPEPGDLHPVLRAEHGHHAPAAARFARRRERARPRPERDPNLAIFRQTDNGVLVRMALFALTLDVSDQIEKTSREVNWYTERRF
jgi:aspartate carbamoyltransferase catalytic subunit